MIYDLIGTVKNMSLYGRSWIQFCFISENNRGIINVVYFFIQGYVALNRGERDLVCVRVRMCVWGGGCGGRGVYIITSLATKHRYTIEINTPALRTSFEIIDLCVKLYTRQ